MVSSSTIAASSTELHNKYKSIPKANSAFHPSGVGKWVQASIGKAKAGMVHSVSGWTRGVQVKLWDPLRTRAIPERLRGVITTRRYTNPRLHLHLLSESADLYHVESSPDPKFRARVRMRTSDTNEFQNFVGTLLSDNAFVVKFSCGFDLQFYVRIADKQTDIQTDKQTNTQAPGKTLA